jgi:hypothetical protein
MLENDFWLSKDTLGYIYWLAFKIVAPSACQVIQTW